MKVLQINCVYHDGSTGKISRDIHHYLLSQGISSVVLYGRGRKIRDVGVQKVCGEGYGKLQNLFSRIRGTLYGGCWSSTWRILHIIQREKPDVVHLQCINGHFVNVYWLVSWLKKKGIRTILTLHAEFLYTGNCGHALDCERWRTGCGHCPRLRREIHSLIWDQTAKAYRQMQSAFAGFQDGLTVVSVSPWLQQRAESAPILRDKKHMVIGNGVDTELFTYRPAPDVRKRFGITDEKIIFFAAPVFSDEPDHLKGGYYLLELAKRMRDQPIRFLVAGRCNLHKAVPDNVVLLGEIRDRQQLAAYYSAADVTLLTSRRETFSMVCAESLCCGTPVVGFSAGGPETIALAKYATFVKYADMKQLEAAVQKVLRTSWNKACISAESCQRYDNQQMLKRYMALYREE